MKVPIGILRVRNFSVVKHDLNIGYCKLTPTDTVEIQGQSVEAVDPTEPVHQVFNPVEFQEQAVSLHIYSKPIERFLMYEPTMDRCVISSPRDYSEYGQLCAPHARI